jgi:hypothetical protein
MKYLGPWTPKSDPKKNLWEFEDTPSANSLVPEWFHSSLELPSLAWPGLPNEPSTSSAQEVLLL